MKNIIVCGDSHTGVFRFMNNKQKTSILMYAKLVFLELTIFKIYMELDYV
jgi:hypothetical protein